MENLSNRKSISRKITQATILAGIFLTGCQQSAVSLTETPTQTPIPTSAPTSTATPMPVLSERAFTLEEAEKSINVWVDLSFHVTRIGRLTVSQHPEVVVSEAENQPVVMFAIVGDQIDTAKVYGAAFTNLEDPDNPGEFVEMPMLLEHDIFSGESRSFGLNFIRDDGNTKYYSMLLVEGEGNERQVVNTNKVLRFEVSKPEGNLRGVITFSRENGDEITLIKPIESDEKTEFTPPSVAEIPSEVISIFINLEAATEEVDIEASIANAAAACDNFLTEGWIDYKNPHQPGFFIYNTNYVVGQDLSDRKLGLEFITFYDETTSGFENQVVLNATPVLLDVFKMNGMQVALWGAISKNGKPFCYLAGNPTDAIAYPWISEIVWGETKDSNPLFYQGDYSRRAFAVGSLDNAIGKPVLVTVGGLEEGADPGNLNEAEYEFLKVAGIDETRALIDVYKGNIPEEMPWFIFVEPGKAEDAILPHKDSESLPDIPLLITAIYFVSE